MAIISTLLVATFVVILNETIMNVALQRLMVDLRVEAPTVQWLSTGFMLHFTWRFMFVFVLPVALAALVIGAKYLTKWGRRRGPPRSWRQPS